MNVRSILALLLLLAGLPLHAAEGKILKVLPFYLDAKGRNALSPSLFDRDAYQALLKRKPELRKALRMDVQFKTASASTNLQLRIELRCNQEGQITNSTHTASVAKTGFTGRWQTVKVEGEAFEKMGSLVAWRATLWDADHQIAEQKSFIW
jgi:hypothetical protein